MSNTVSLGSRNAILVSLGINRYFVNFKVNVHKSYQILILFKNSGVAGACAFAVSSS